MSPGFHLARSFLFELQLWLSWLITRQPWWFLLLFTPPLCAHFPHLTLFLLFSSPYLSSFPFSHLLFTSLFLFCSYYSSSFPSISFLFLIFLFLLFPFISSPLFSFLPFPWFLVSSPFASIAINSNQDQILPLNRIHSLNKPNLWAWNKCDLSPRSNRLVSAETEALSSSSSTSEPNKFNQEFHFLNTDWVFPSIVAPWRFFLSLCLFLATVWISDDLFFFPNPATHRLNHTFNNSRSNYPLLQINKNSSFKGAANRDDRGFVHICWHVSQQKCL